MLTGGAWLGGSASPAGLRGSSTGSSCAGEDARGQVVADGGHAGRRR